MKMKKKREVSLSLEPVLPVACPSERRLHAALCEGARLIGANRGHTAERFNDGKLAHNGVSTRHALHSDGHGDGCDLRESGGERETRK